MEQISIKELQNVHILRRTSGGIIAVYESIWDALRAKHVRCVPNPSLALNGLNPDNREDLVVETVSFVPEKEAR